MQKCCITIELICMKVLMLVRQVCQKSELSTLLLFLDGVFKHQQDICNGCHDLS